ncbi:hypothetical protein RUM43_008576 [Polyplax serrata]|uniref:Uncharacterized protein n=1 Tax=Polyplax serrata TaxID=468196 RepID=A0AAN8PG47_POLSC
MCQRTHQLKLRIERANHFPLGYTQRVGYDADFHYIKNAKEFIKSFDKRFGSGVMALIPRKGSKEDESILSMGKDFGNWGKRMWAL